MSLALEKKKKKRQSISQFSVEDEKIALCFMKYGSEAETDEPGCLFFYLHRTFVVIKAFKSKVYTTCPWERGSVEEDKDEDKVESCSGMKG